MDALISLSMFAKSENALDYTALNIRYIKYYLEQIATRASQIVSVRGKLKLGTKSDIVRCLEDAAEKQDDTSVDVVVVLDGLAILYMLKPAAAGTFCESYVHDVFLPYV